MDLKKEYTTTLISLGFIVSMGMAYVGYYFLRYSVDFDPIMLVSLAVLFLLASGLMMGAGLDLFIKVIGVARTDDTFFDILRDFPPTGMDTTEDMEKRLTKMILVKGNQVQTLELFLEALKERAHLKQS